MSEQRDRELRACKRRLIRGLSKMERDTKDLIDDIESWNTCHPNDEPFDAGADVVRLKGIQKALACVRNNRPIDAKTWRMVCNIGDIGK